MAKPVDVRTGLMWSLSPVVLLVSALVLVWGTRTALGQASAPRVLKLATGSPGGTAIEAGDELAHIAERALPNTKVEIVNTGGGDENLARLLAGEVDLAIVHNTGSSWGDAEQAARVIGPLYDEALQLVVRRDLALEDLSALEGHAVYLGPVGSCTNRLVQQLLKAAEVKVQGSDLQHLDAAKALVEGKLDAFFVLAGVRSSAVEFALSSGRGTLISLGDPNQVGSALEGYRVVLPSLDTVVIPAHAYGAQPVRPIGTLGVSALWVTRSTMTDSAAWSLAKSLSEQRRAAAETFPLLAHTTTKPNEARLRFPLHEGAARFYHRDDPPFILAWADTLSLVVTVAVLLWSAGVGVLRWRLRQRKFRVDRYYAELQEMSKRLEGAKSYPELRALRRELYALRRRAVDDLMAGRLEPDESFTIFQDYVRSEIQEIDQLARDPALTTAVD